MLSHYDQNAANILKSKGCIMSWARLQTALRLELEEIS